MSNATKGPKALVLQAPGTNCDLESRDALRRAGADAELVPVQDLFAEPERLLRARILMFPGGFAHGDDIASARILANQCRLRLGDSLLRFVDQEGGYVLGICNGFQALVKMGLLPRTGGGPLRQQATLTHNDSGHYECRWVRLKIEQGNCAFLPEGEVFELPIGHGEGKFIPGPDLPEDGGSYTALRYVDDEGNPTQSFPANPNGSLAAIAGMCDETGRVLGMMPHPDRAYLPPHHPLWPSPEAPSDPSGARFFRLLVEAAAKP
ncbi:MAG TPA: phosphoribosylformylglycinamidine synthase subunit PurQ [Planctomycetes bacterium]|nr:phosphoribosylformylglycinamidine synthase subunit PurQ [Planctomycetota bacterium]